MAEWKLARDKRAHRARCEIVPWVYVADLLHQGKRRGLASMATGAGAHCDEAISALGDGLLCVVVVRDVVHHQAAVGMHRLVDVFARAK